MQVNKNDLIVYLFCFKLKEFCQTDDCRSGDCELIRLSNGLIQKDCHCVKVNFTN